MNAAQELAITIGAAPACRAFGLARASFYRQYLGKPAAAKVRRQSARALSDRERQDVLEVLHSERFVDQAPREVYTSLRSALCHAA
jgi:putative transposase